MRSLVLLVLAVIFYYFIKSLFSSSRQRMGQWSQGKALKEVDDMVKDPSCEVYISKSTALEAVFKGERVYFCSEKCLEKFKQQNSL